MAKNRFRIIRADGSIETGTGHLMRMLALGQAFRDQQAEVHFACAEITDALAEALVRENFKVWRMGVETGSFQDAEETVRLALSVAKNDPSGALVVLDGYKFGEDFQLTVKEAGLKQLVVDDYGHAGYYHADWILNQNTIHWSHLNYKHGAGTVLLMGAGYAMLRKEFLHHRGATRAIPPVARNILVTLGGSDPDNLTLDVIRVLTQVGLGATVIVGGSNPHAEQLGEFLAQNKREGVAIELVRGANRMADWMSWADLAISSAGSTAWELSFMGVPTIYINGAENQRVILETIEQMALGVCVEQEGSRFRLDSLRGHLADLVQNEGKRRELSRRAGEVVDGYGCQRIAEATG